MDRAYAVDFARCLAEIQQAANQTQDMSNLRFNNGSSVPLQSIANATAITYSACASQCGIGQAPFNWAIFSKDFAAWLLPYLALISQLPFGAEYQLDNLMSAVLTVGSPTLAAYSLFLTLLNSRWIKTNYRKLAYPTPSLTQTVASVLSSLQQVPLRVRPGGSAVFESLVVLPANSEWWTTFAESLNYTHSWSISSGTSITWVIIAYFLAFADSVSNVEGDINSNGQGTGSLAWIWLVPVVVGWLVLAPRCDYSRIQYAYKMANKRIVTAGAETNNLHPNPGLTVEPEKDDICSPDEARTPPVFNYAKALAWSRSASIALEFYKAAWKHAQENTPADVRRPWIAKDNNGVGNVNGDEERREVVDYCRPEGDPSEVHWAPGVISRMVLASLLGLGIQWGTVGAAFMSEFITPPKGLGCRSLSYLLYGACSTLVWFLLVLSSIFAHSARPPFIKGHYCPHPAKLKTLSRSSHLSNPPRMDGEASTSLTVPATTATLRDNEDNHMPNSSASATSNDRHYVLKVSADPLAGQLPQHKAKALMMTISDCLRWAAKCIASINAVLIIAVSVLQFANFFNRCYCNASVLGVGRDRAYFIVSLQGPELALVRTAWITGLVLASGSSLIFVFCIYLLADSLP